MSQQPAIHAGVRPMTAPPHGRQLAQQRSPKPIEATTGEFVEKVSKLMVSWMLSLQQMEAYEVNFACRLADCSAQSEAIALCKQWTSHRIDSIKGMQGQLLELWLDAAATAATGTDPNDHWVATGNTRHES